MVVSRRGERRMNGGLEQLPERLHGKVAPMSPQLRERRRSELHGPNRGVWPLRD
jgi:hypothetical protein